VTDPKEAKMGTFSVKIQRYLSVDISSLDLTQNMCIQKQFCQSMFAMLFRCLLCCFLFFNFLRSCNSVRMSYCIKRLLGLA